MAQRFPSRWLDDLRERADIVQTVSAYVPLKKNGQKYWGLCPFHNEKTASFSVDPERQMYYCFGCKANGTVFHFIMGMEHLSFYDAVVHVADQQHVPLPEMVNDPDWQRRRTQRERLLAANKAAAQYYHQMLFTPQGEASLQYLKGRGLSDAVIRRFGLGAAPDRWDALTQHLLEQGYTEEELRLAGLTRVKEEKDQPRKVFDMFRNRAIFPIIDQYGNVIAFGGRTLGDDKPKYLNTSDTPVFNKRHNVYAANLLKKERQLDRAILVEGYMDVVALTQFGVRGVCATLGTALTEEQARLIARFAPRIYLAYDGDSAGQHAILRGLDILQAQGIPARVLEFPDGLDPDEFIRRDGAEAFERLPALSPEAYRMRRLREEYDLSTQDGRTEYAKACAPILNRLEPVELENALKDLTVQTGFPREVLLAQVQSVPTQARAAQPQIRTAPPRPQVEALPEGIKAQETLISLLASGMLPADIVRGEDLEDPLLRNLYDGLIAGKSPAELVENLEDEQERARVISLLTATTAEDRDQAIGMAQDCLNRLHTLTVQRRIDALRASLPTLTGEARSQALLEIQQLQNQKKQYKNHLSN